MSTALMAVIVTEPRRQYTPLYRYLPRILDAPRVATDQQGNDVLCEIGGDRQLTPVQRGVAETVEAVLGFDFQRDEVAARGTDNDFRVDDLHCAPQDFRTTSRGGTTMR